MSYVCIYIYTHITTTTTSNNNTNNCNNATTNNNDTNHNMFRLIQILSYVSYPF